MRTDLLKRVCSWHFRTLWAVVEYVPIGSAVFGYIWMCTDVLKMLVLFLFRMLLAEVFESFRSILGIKRKTF